MKFQERLEEFVRTLIMGPPNEGIVVMSCSSRCGCGGIMSDCFSDEQADAWDRQATYKAEMDHLALEEARLRVKKLKQECGEEAAAQQSQESNE